MFPQIGTAVSSIIVFKFVANTWTIMSWLENSNKIAINHKALLGTVKNFRTNSHTARFTEVAKRNYDTWSFGGSE